MLSVFLPSGDFPVRYFPVRHFHNGYCLSALLGFSCSVHQPEIEFTPPLHRSPHDQPRIYFLLQGSRHAYPGRCATPPVLMTSLTFDASSVVHFRSSPQLIPDLIFCKAFSCSLSTVTLLPITAPAGGLQPSPCRWLRRAYLHLMYSIAVYTKNVIRFQDTRRTSNLRTCKSRCHADQRGCCTTPDYLA